MRLYVVPSDRGGAPVRFVCVDTDGSIGQVDTLKSAFENAAETCLNVRTSSFDEALRHPDIQIRQIGIAGLGGQCKECRLVSVCGGGYYPHRYDGEGFFNRSVYCADLIKLITHVRTAVVEQLLRNRVVDAPAT